MSRLANNEILRQYKRLHRENAAVELEQSSELLNGAGAVDGENAGNSLNGRDDFSPLETSGAAVVEEEVQDVDAFEEIGGGHSRENALASHGGSQGAGTTRVSVPPAVAKSISSANPRSGERPLTTFQRPELDTKKTSPVKKGEPGNRSTGADTYGVDLDGAGGAATGKGSLGAESSSNRVPTNGKHYNAPAPRANGGIADASHCDSDDEDEFPDIDDAVIPAEASSPLVHSSASYVSPVEQLRQEQVAAAAANVHVCDDVSSSSSSDSGKDDEDDGNANDGDRNDDDESPAENLNPSSPGTGVTLSTMTATVSNFASHLQNDSICASSSRAVGGGQSVPIVGEGSSLFAVSPVTPMEESTGAAGGTGSRRKRWHSLSQRDGTPTSTAQASDGPRSTTQPPQTAAANQTPVPVSAEALAAALRDPEINVDEDDGDAWVTTPQQPRSTTQERTSGGMGDHPGLIPFGQTVAARQEEDESGRSLVIAFWPAVFAMHADRQAWWSYTVTSEPGSGGGDGRGSVVTPREGGAGRKSTSFFFCCSRDGDVASKRSGDTGEGSGSSGKVSVADNAFVSALRRMPLDRTDPTLECVLTAVYHGVVESTDGPRTPAERRHASVSWERIGFQGTNPATDLRSSGVLGLFAALYVVSHYPGLTARLWRVCNPTAHTAQRQQRGVVGINNDLPFVLILFNFLGVVMDLVRKCGEKNFVAASAANRNGFYAALEGRSSRPGGAEQSITAAFQPCMGLGAGDEAAALRPYPLLHSVCEALVGVLQLFYESWMKLTEDKRPALPFVGDFGAQKAAVSETVLRGSSTAGVTLVMRSAIKARGAQ